MDPLLARERDIEVDLESGGTTSEDERTKDRVKGERGINSCSSSSSFGGVEGENVELLTDKNSEGEENHEFVVLAEKNLGEAKCKKTNTRKSPKPPRPPKGPLLDAADQKLVREIAELAMRKRISTRQGASVMSEGSPAPSVGSGEGLISVQFYKSFPMTGNHDHDLPGLLEQQVSGSVIGKKPEKLPDEVEK
ncbi:Detected protein of unknown function [Hibiscus syriacus]|uniref:Uncharacterized protein n=1 Tax=Hibiscus syriacus TaxID=106335 RepID=A0A6A3CG52_HIBSY|nr:Detected protein of unknown function [Hibiscus syriacus]